MKKFEVLITERTAAIYPSYDGVHQSKVVDCSGKVTYSKKSVKEVLEESCIVHGSDYNGRIRAVRQSVVVRSQDAAFGKSDGLYPSHSYTITR